MPKKLLFISSANLTVNPRILKELKFAIKLGYEVDFRLCCWDNIKM